MKPHPSPMTPRQATRRNKAINLLNYVAQGYKISTAASMMRLSCRSGEMHLNRIKEELGAVSLANAVFLAVKRGWIN